MQFHDFIAFHSAALAQEPARYNLMYGLMHRLRGETDAKNILTWTLGAPGACAMKTPNRSILLGNLSKEQCHRLADETVTLDYPGVIGNDDAPIWFRERAEQLGITFPIVLPQSIQTLCAAPTALDVAGEARQGTAEDYELLRAWKLAFWQEATPHELPPQDADIRSSIENNKIWFWCVDDVPVAFAALGRRTETMGSIGPVYTPPECRSKGYAGAVTAVVARYILAQGLSTACLYTNLQNPASNRCYEKLGFRILCKSWLLMRG